MMPEQSDLLEQLRDIHLPPAPSWWPPAIGWWLLAGLLVAAIVLSQYLLRRKRYRPATTPSQLVWSELDRLRNDFVDDANATQLLAGLSALIRQVAMTISTREEVAKLTGDAWLNWLDKRADKVLFVSDDGRMFAYAHYQSNAKFEVDAILQICEEWLSIIFAQSDHA